jgi:hypothetical protein
MTLCPVCQNKLSTPECAECGNNGYVSSAEEIQLNVLFNLAGEPVYQRSNGKNAVIAFLFIYGVIIFIGSCVALYLEAR